MPVLGGETREALLPGGDGVSLGGGGVCSEDGRGDTIATESHGKCSVL